MSAEETAPFIERSASDVFATLDDETRITILEALIATEGVVSFTALRRQIGMRDSGQFNCHLSKLLGTFVCRTDDGAYELTYRFGLEHSTE